MPSLMPSSPSLPLDEYDESFSSPDPLATSVNDENAPPLVRRSATPKQSFSSPTKSKPIYESITITTPPRTTGGRRNQNQSPSRKGSEQLLSPWKIRVTVEAEPEDMEIQPMRTRSRTVKVPLREASSPATATEPKRRGRSNASSAVKTKRSATPVRGRGRSGSRNRRPSVTDLDITVLGDDAESDDWTKKKSPAKRKQRQVRRGRQDSVMTDVSEQTDIPERHVASTSGKEKREAETVDTFRIRADSETEEVAAILPSIDENSPELRTIDLRKVSVRPRSLSTKHRKTVLAESEASERSTPDELPPQIEFRTSRQISDHSAASYPTPTPSVQDESDRSLPFPDPTDDHDGYDTILESEGFTMIDLESISSARNFLSSPLEVQAQPLEAPAENKDQNIIRPTFLAKSSASESAIQGQQQSTRPPPTAIPSYLTLQEGESDISSNVPSSPPVDVQTNLIALRPPQQLQLRQTTPEPYESPRLPSPPKAQPSVNASGESTARQGSPPKLARAVKAGNALQGLLSPKRPPLQQSPLIKDHPGSHTNNPDDLFGGFDSGTKRELRAGLRFGEELAKRFRSSPSAVKVGSKLSQEIRLDTQAQVWRGEAVVQHTPIQQPKSNSRNGAEKHGLTKASGRSRDEQRPKSPIGLSTPESSTPARDEQAPKLKILDTQARREHEWQLEREAVSREIENANPSQVIVIDSDGDDEDIEISHIQEQSDAAQTANLFPTNEQRKQRERALEVTSKPRRSLIPSPWKRGEDIEGASTFLTNGDMSGMLWLDTVDKAKFGSAEIERVRREARSSSERGRNLALDRDESDRREDSDKDAKDCSSGQANVEDDQKEIDSADESILDWREFGTSSDHPSATDEPSHDFDGSSVHSIESEPSALIEEHSSSLLPHQPVKIPVNFNDSTLSDFAYPATRSSPSVDAPDSSRPGTPRSAMKGTRLSLGLGSAELEQAVRKVVFSDRNLCVDEDGLESSLTLQSASLSQTPVVAHDALSSEAVPSNKQHTEREEEPEEGSEASMTASSAAEKKSGWLGWLWNSSSSLAGGKIGTDSNALTREESNEKAENDESDEWVPTKTSISTTFYARTAPAAPSTQKRSRSTPSYLLPPSYPSDPRRTLSSSPLSTSGEFSNSHFRTLHIIYLKSKGARFHAPRTARPAVQALVGEKLSCDEADFGVFEWTFGRVEALVVERFMQEVEWGWKLAKLDRDWQCVWGWREKELAWWLFRIVVGEVVRGEAKARETIVERA